MDRRSGTWTDRTLPSRLRRHPFNSNLPWGDRPSGRGLIAADTDPSVKSHRTLNSKEALAFIRSLPPDATSFPANIHFSADLDARGTKIEVFDNYVAGIADFSGSQLRQLGPHAHYKALKMENTPLKDRLLLYRKNMERRAQFPDEVALLVGEPDNSLWVHPTAPLPKKILEATNTTVAITGPFVLPCETRGGSVTPLFVHSRNGDDLDRHSKAEQKDAFDKIKLYLDAALTDLDADCLDNRRDPNSFSFPIPPDAREAPTCAQGR